MIDMYKEYMLNPEQDKQYIDIYYSMGSVDPEHSILLNNEIGLLGEGIDEEPNMEIYYDGHKENEVAIISNTAGTVYGFRGNYFIPIDNDGCILTTEYVDFVGLVLRENNKTSYIFGLKDHHCSTSLDSFLYDIDIKEKALVLYEDGVIYTNEFEGASDIGKLKSNLSVKYCGNFDYTLDIENETYHSSRLTDNYDFYIFYNKKSSIEN